MNWKRNDNVEEEQIDNQVLVFDPESFKFFELNETMSFIWKLLGDSKTEDELVTAMLEEFDVDRNELTKDVREALEDLSKNKLVKEF